MKLTSFALVVALTAFASVAEATYSLPASRSVTWQGNVGVLNDIPARTTIYRTLSPSGSNDATAIQTAINGCPAGQVVKLNRGTFIVSSPITVKSGVTLRGSGMGATILKGTAGMTGTYVIGMSAGSSLGTPINLSAGLNKGSTTITTASAHGWSAGDIILIDQLNNASAIPPVTNAGSDGTCTWCGRSSGTRSLGQMVRVTAVPNSTTATLEIPLYWNYLTSRTAQGTKMLGMTRDAGIEDLSIDNTVSGSSKQADNGGTILLRGTSNSWLLRVEGIGSYQNMVRVYNAYRNTIRSSKFHEGVPPTPINGTQYAHCYGIWLNPSASANLFENNQLYHLRVPFMLNGAVSGNVISYNYITELYSDSGSSNFQLAAISTHGSHPMMNLIEGNYTVGRMRADDVWGSSSHNTFFRNKEMLAPNRTSGTYAFDLHKHQQYYNLVGNVIGTLGVENTYELNNATISGHKSVYRFGYTSDGDRDATGNDPQVLATILRHGNWDSATNGVLWNGADDRVLPASFYLSAKPAWWGNVAWPAVGPDVSPRNPVAPAAGQGTPWGTAKPPLSPPGSLKAE